MSILESCLSRRVEKEMIASGGTQYVSKARL